MSVEVQKTSDIEVTRRPPPRTVRAMRVRARKFSRAVEHRLSSSLTRRIVVLNLGGLVALLVGFLYLNQFRAGLIDARVQSLATQGEIIASAIAASATVDSDAITIDPERLLQLAPGQSYDVAEEARPSFEFSINPERVGPLLRRLVSPTRTRARIYDRDGYLLIDSRSLTSRSTILRSDLPAPNQEESQSWLDRLWAGLKGHLGRRELPIYEDIGAANGKAYPEVSAALSGGADSVVRMNAQGETIVSVAVPIQRFRTVRGALLLSTQGGDIDQIIASERWAIIRIFVVSAGVMLLLSLFFAGTVAEPMRRLAEAADRVRRGIISRQQIPDFSDRPDEIGHLSAALRDMTKALYTRIEAIESFAADVAHELKNPLTSLRSAVETLPIAKTEASRDRLLAVIQHDVSRLDRLISDISDASRLDAELARGAMEPLDLSVMLEAVVSMANQATNGHNVTVTLKVEEPPEEFPDAPWVIQGHDSRLGQVCNNLIDNARSFSPEGGSVRVTLRAAELPGNEDEMQPGYEIIIDDNGPGIPAHAFERIFERFYTDRPNHGFGQNSGLGLAISRQIIEAHGGRIQATNRTAAPTGNSLEGEILGARFIVWLPIAR
ncbi:MAG TPA: sensor histidine kinase [Beijerinckiaceae bacterium]|jgi:two-component system, OmpR family, sensor histidine kinase ChvG|nr:sensor histidine kinase [Beijerinckiaceae bacterium]